MKNKISTSLIVIAVLYFPSGCGTLLRSALGHSHPSTQCIARGKAYAARSEKLKQDAAEVLKVGAKKDAVIRFFQDNRTPPSFVGDEVTGTIFLKGCAPPGCGTDDALLGLRVKVDKEGTVVSAPVVGALYTDCL
jgi:hypothetical protein